MSIMQNKILQKLQVLEPTLLEVKDVSHHHAGHSGWREGGESHFNIAISSKEFEGLSRLESHKLIHKILAEELKEIHALQISIK